MESSKKFRMEIPVTGTTKRRDDLRASPTFEKAQAGLSNHSAVHSPLEWALLICASLDFISGSSVSSILYNWYFYFIWSASCELSGLHVPS
jgi:hypothetical protein